MEFESAFEKLERVCNLIILQLDDIKDIIFKLEHEIKGSLKYNNEEQDRLVQNNLTSSHSTSEQITNN